MCLPLDTFIQPARRFPSPWSPCFLPGTWLVYLVHLTLLYNRWFNHCEFFLPGTWLVYLVPFKTHFCNRAVVPLSVIFPSRFVNWDALYLYIYTLCVVLLSGTYEHICFTWIYVLLGPPLWSYLHLSQRDYITLTCPPFPPSSVKRFRSYQLRTSMYHCVL